MLSETTSQRPEGSPTYDTLEQAALMPRFESRIPGFSIKAELLEACDGNVPYQ